jgi:hypothetical protein
MRREGKTTMIEILLMLAATAAVFAAFLLVFSIREKTGKGPVDLRPCARCDCERSSSAPQQSLAFYEQNAAGNDAEDVLKKKPPGPTQ